MLKESADLVILGGGPFDPKVTLEKHLRSVSGAAAQRLGPGKNVLASIPTRT